MSVWPKLKDREIKILGQKDISLQRAAYLTEKTQNALPLGCLLTVAHASAGPVCPLAGHFSPAEDCQGQTRPL